MAAVALGSLLGGAIYGVGSQALPNLINGEGFGCIDPNEVLLYSGAGLLIGAGLAVAFWLGSGAGLGATLTAGQISGGVAAASGAATNVIGQGLIGAYNGAASVEELIARVSADMAIGGVSGRVMAGVVNQIPINPNGLVNQVTSVATRGVSIGSVNVIQGIVQRTVRSSVFGDEGFNPLGGSDILGDFIWGFGLQAVSDISVLRSTEAGSLVIQRPGYITRYPVPNRAGDIARSANVARFADQLVNQITFIITGTNITPNALSSMGADRFLLDLITGE